MLLIRGQGHRRLRLISLPLGIWLAPLLAASVVACAGAARVDRSLTTGSAIAIIAAAILVAVVIVGQSPLEHLTLDIGAGSLELGTRNLLTRKRTAIGPFPLRDLVELRETRSQDAVGDPVARLQLCLRDGTSLWFPDTATTTDFAPAMRAVNEVISQLAH